MKTVLTSRQGIAELTEVGVSRSSARMVGKDGTTIQEGAQAVLIDTSVTRLVRRVRLVGEVEA